MKYRIIATSRFEKDVKRCKKRNLPMEKLKKGKHPTPILAV